MSARAWATVGSVASAAASSACCWLPLAMVASGLSAAGAARFFESFRVPFLAGAGVLLGVGLFLEYRPPRTACDPDGRCVLERPRARRLQRGMLWVSTGLVLAFAFFPSYVGGLVEARVFGNGPAARETTLAGSERLVLTVRGMTCAGCEAGVVAALEALPGVRQATANASDGEAILHVEPGSAPARLALAVAVGKAGYELVSVDR